VAGFAQLCSDTRQLADSFVRSFTVLVTLLLPVCAALAVLAEPLLNVLYGPRIAPAAGALTWLVTLGGVRVAVGLVFDVLLSQGRSRTTFRLQLVWLVAVVPALSIAAHLGGIAAVAFAHMAVAVLVAVPMHLWAVRDVGIAPSRLGEVLIRPALGVVASVAVGIIAVNAISNSLAALLLGGAAMVGVYFLTAVTPAEARQLVRLAR
jgi:O-antigen/teichoic acid export membrane protein